MLSISVSLMTKNRTPFCYGNITQIVLYDSATGNTLALPYGRMHTIVTSINGYNNNRATLLFVFENYKYGGGFDTVLISDKTDRHIKTGQRIDEDIIKDSNYFIIQAVFITECNIETFNYCPFKEIRFFTTNLPKDDVHIIVGNNNMFPLYPIHCYTNDGCMFKIRPKIVDYYYEPVDFLNEFTCVVANAECTVFDYDDTIINIESAVENLSQANTLYRENTFVSFNYIQFLSYDGKITSFHDKFYYGFECNHPQANSLEVNENMARICNIAVEEYKSS